MSEKILVVDDESFNVDYLEQELEDLGYESIYAYHGREALALALSHQPILILLDLVMPVMDGFTCLEELKKNPQTQHIPVIIISALDDLSNLVRGIELGAEDYMTKPIEPVLLASRIRSCLSKYSLRKGPSSMDTSPTAPSEGWEFQLYEQATENAVQYADVLWFALDIESSEQVDGEQYEQMNKAFIEACYPTLHAHKVLPVAWLGTHLLALSTHSKADQQPLLQQRSNNMLQCAQAMQELASHFQPSLHSRAALHRGPVSFGRMNIHFAGGRTIDLARMALERCTQDRLLVSEEIWNEIKDTVRGELVDTIQLTNTMSFHLYRVEALQPPTVDTSND